MHIRVLSVLLLVASFASAATPPPRYIPAPKGRGYLMVFGTVLPVGGLIASERDITISGGGSRTDIEWITERYEFGAVAGYGLGPWWFIKGTELSIGIPASLRSFELREYTLDKFPDTKGSGRLMQSLHESLQVKKLGGGLSDIQASVLSLFVADPGAGRFISGALKAGIPTGTSTAKQYVRILHGEKDASPGDGAGVVRLIPAISGVQSVARQRVYLNIEYAIPLGKEKFSIDTPDQSKEGEPFADSNTRYEEEFAAGGVLAGTLGLDTTLDLWGVTPGFEVTFRQYAKTKWTENGKDPFLPTGARFPVFTPEFLNTYGWASGLPLKDITEVEISLTASMKPKAGDLVKIYAVYLWNTYGYCAGAKMTFTNLFEALSEEDLLRMSGPGAKAMEVNVAPVLDAPPPPTGRIATAVTTPVAGNGVTSDDVEGLAKEIRRQLDRVGGYSVMSAGDMAQLSTEQCGDGDCGLRFGRALRQQAMVVGRLDRTEAGLTLTLRMVGITQNTVSSPQSASAADLSALRKEIPSLMQRLTRPEAPAKPGGTR